MSDPRSPSTISGLVGWYTGLSAEVTSGSVSSWKDISGQGNHATTIRGSPKVDSTGVDTTGVPGSPTVAFHYGNFDNHYGDGTRANAAKVGRIYADTLSAEIPPEFGSLVSASTASGQTTYTWVLPSSVNADVLVVAGGGTGGNNKVGIYENGGGGGAGGVVYKTNQTLNPASYTIVVGQGGIIPAGNGQNKGKNTTAFGYTALGGGGGSTRDSQTNINGGSGGGAVNWSPNTTNGQATQPGSASGGYGNDGGTATQVASTNGSSAGGGGAGGAGFNGSGTTGANGGSGLYVGVFGDTYGQNGYFAGGGGGGGAGGGLGGVGGGGAAGSVSSVNGTNGTAHTGGGGGGNFAETGNAGNGGSGIVLIKFYVPVRGATQFPFLWGGTGDGLTFPTAVMTTTSNHTLFHVARHYNPTGAPTRARIFNGATLNWLSGFWSGRSGVAYHGAPPNGGWLTPQPDLHGDQWVLSTDQRNMYRSNGTNRTSSGYSNGASDQLTINTRYELSDWAVAEVIVFNRELTSAEYLSVEAYLFAKYFSNAIVPATGVISGSLLNAIFYTGTDGVGGSAGYPISINRLGRTLWPNGLSLTKGASNFRGRGSGGRIDGISSSPSAAYSVRKLFRSYTGPQFQVSKQEDDLSEREYLDVYTDKDGNVVSVDGYLSTTLPSLSDYVEVIRWYDQSGNGRHTTGYGAGGAFLPRLLFIGGRYVIYFPGSSANAGGYFSAGSFTFNIASNGGVSTFSRVNFLTQDNWERVYDYGNGSANNNLLLARIGTTQSTRFEMFQGSAPQTLDSSSITNNTWHSFGNRISGSGTSWTFTTRRDGSQVASSVKSVSFTNRTITNSYIGRSNWSGDNYSAMYLSDQIFFDRGITDADFVIMESALA